MSGPGVDGPELVARARALTPLLAAHAREAELARRPSDEVIEALRAARIFDLMVPECHGGLELDLDTFLDVGLALGEGDAAMAWVSTFYIEHNWMFCQFPAAFQKELYAEASHVLAPAAISPGGTAQAVAGGYRLTGRYPWGTGIAHADWVIVSALTTERDGTGGVRFLAMPRADVTVEDVWFVDGMSGTGSNTIVVDDVVVPSERTVSIPDMVAGTAPGALIHEGPLYRTPMLPILAVAAAMPAVGQARAAVRRFAGRMTERVLLMTQARQSDKPAAQARLAAADIEVTQAELLLRAVVDEVMARRDATTEAQRARLIATVATAVDRAKHALQSISAASGAGAHFLSDPLQRAVRDVQTLSCHTLFALDERLEAYGRTLVGLDPGTPV
ncbi:MAG TPA: hypothetical protein VFI47_24155 [Acidimicrobiales bacterium]|nr:hypothetical protein [Acidimicrobiales bacterium]